MHLKKPLFTTMVTAGLAVAMAVAFGTSPAAGKPGGDKPEESASDLAVVAADAGFRAGAIDAALSAKSSKVQGRIVAFVRAHGTKHTFAAYTDETTGRVVLETDASADVVDSLISDVRSSVDVRQARRRR